MEKGELFTAKFYRSPLELHKITGFKAYDSGETGIETVRFIKTRGGWAKHPKAWVTIEDISRNPEFYNFNATIESFLY